MNSDRWGGKWQEIKGKIKAAFGQLTDDDLAQIQGSAEHAVGVLQSIVCYPEGES